MDQGEMTMGKGLLQLCALALAVALAQLVGDVLGRLPLLGDLPLELQAGRIAGLGLVLGMELWSRLRRQEASLRA